MKTLVAPEFVWSRKLTCPKCRQSTRLRRVKTANKETDFWTHLGPGCQVRISHYIIAVDIKCKQED
jgi:hypothetical protein